jgi:tetratricopeptide (TPR) repeat protein
VIARALALALALGAPRREPAPAPVPAPAPAAAAAAPAAPAAKDPAAPPPAAPEAAPEEAPDPDVMGFLSLTNSTASRDGAVKLPWEGPGGMQLKLSWDALEKRNEQLALGDMMARSLIDVVRVFFDTEGGLDPQAMRAKLAALTGAPMQEARAAYLEAVTWEERRLFFVERAVAEAQAQKVALPGIDPELVRRRVRAIRSGAVTKAMVTQIEGYGDLALGLVAYLDGDKFRALERVRKAAGALPDFAVAHAFLGSLYFLFDQKDAAVVAWRRANELDPSNEAVREALKQYGRSPKKQARDSR